MNIREAAVLFVEKHKKKSIDVDYIKEIHGSIEEYLLHNGTREDGNSFDMYYEIHPYHSISGTPERIEWDQEEQ